MESTEGRSKVERLHMSAIDEDTNRWMESLHFCISHVRFSFMINGNHTSFVCSSRGLSKEPFISFSIHLGDGKYND